MSSKFAEMAEKLAQEHGLFELAERAAIRQLSRGLVKASAGGSDGDPVEEPLPPVTFRKPASDPADASATSKAMAESESERGFGRKALDFGANAVATGGTTYGAWKAGKGAWSGLTHRSTSFSPDSPLLRYGADRGLFGRVEDLTGLSAAKGANTAGRVGVESANAIATSFGAKGPLTAPAELLPHMTSPARHPFDAVEHVAQTLGGMRRHAPGQRLSDYRPSKVKVPGGGETPADVIKKTPTEVVTPPPPPKTPRTRVTNVTPPPPPKTPRTRVTNVTPQTPTPAAATKETAADVIKGTPTKAVSKAEMDAAEEGLLGGYGSKPAVPPKAPKIKLNPTAEAEAALERLGGAGARTLASTSERQLANTATKWGLKKILTTGGALAAGALLPQGKLMAVDQVMEGTPLGQGSSPATGSEIATSRGINYSVLGPKGRAPYDREADPTGMRQKTKDTGFGFTRQQGNPQGIDTSGFGPRMYKPPAKPLNPANFKPNLPEAWK